MSQGPAQPLPRDVEPRKLVAQRVDLGGTIAVAKLPRLLTALADESGTVTVALRFAVDEQGLMTVSGTASTEVQAVCQRCLEPMALPLAADLELAIVRDEAEAKALPRQLDPWVVSDDHADLHEIIEEELLLAMPFAPSHPEAECSVKPDYSTGDVAEETREADNPFSILQQLKDSSD